MDKKKWTIFAIIIAVLFVLGLWPIATFLLIFSGLIYLGALIVQSTKKK